MDQFPICGVELTSSNNKLFPAYLSRRVCCETKQLQESSGFVCKLRSANTAAWTSGSFVDHNRPSVPHKMERQPVEMVRLAREEEVYEREAVLGRDTASVFPTQNKTEACSTALQTLAGKQFISESELETLRSTRGARVEDGAVSVDKSLAEVLQENKAKKEAEFQGTWKRMKQGEAAVSFNSTRNSQPSTSPTMIRESDTARPGPRHAQTPTTVDYPSGRGHHTRTSPRLRSPQPSGLLLHCADGCRRAYVDQ